MHQKEIEEEVTMEHIAPRSTLELFSMGNIITLVVSLIAVAVAFGVLTQKVDSNSDAILLLQQRDITPGAAMRIAAIESTVRAMQGNEDRQSIEATEFRREIRNSLDRIEAKIDQHSNGGR